MLSLLLNPDFVLGNLTGLAAGALAASALIFGGYRAAERRLDLEAARIRARAQGARAANGWARAGAANDENSGTRRAQMRGGPR